MGRYAMKAEKNPSLDWQVRRAAGRGFTLIELLLVLVILATLAAIVVPKIAGRGEEAKIKTAITQISMFKTALDTFEIDCGRYPTSEEGLQALVTQPSTIQGWNSRGYLDALPKDPWGNPYIYHCPGTHNTKGFDLYSTGLSGQDGAPDNIDNWTQK